MRVRQVQLCCLVVFLVVVVAAQLMPRLASSASAEARDGFKKIVDASERLAPGASKNLRLPAADAKRIHSLTVSLPAPAALGEADSLTVTLRSGQQVIAGKTLHVGDPDLYTLFCAAGATEVEIASASRAPISYAVSVVEWPASKASKTVIEVEPNDTWREANEFQLGQTIWATADDKPYIQPLNAKPAKSKIPYQQTPEFASGDVLPEGGVDWFKFSYDGQQPKLVHFELDLPERDNLPVDVSIFKVENDEARVYEEGIDPVSPPHEVQALPGNKFTTRLLSRGTYFVRVDANHVLYQLRTSVYDAPPYADPRAAIRAGMDYIISAGDSWHANTPRHGGLVNRVGNSHAETQLCIACHATHFPTRAELTAKHNGYAVMKRSSLEFLTERLANNPRPFYGFPEASWTRVISASANVMSRLASLVNIHEDEFKLPHNIALLRGVGNYLKIYYKGRTVLPNDETNGNTPIVSTYEVAWYSWRVFDQLVKLDSASDAAGSDKEYRDRIRSLIEQDAHKNLIDLCYQTLAFAEMDQTGYADKIKRNAERILSLQREDGQWSMLFEAASTPVEFQTYHCLYTLARAGYKTDHPQIAKSLKFLISRQQAFGGWFDPRQTYENFRTPFRETQFAVMALSEFYKGPEQKGWQQGFDALPVKLAEQDAMLRLEQIDNVWDKPGRPVINDLLASLQSAEPMMRAAAAVTLGRVGEESAVAPLGKLLGDSSKMVQIASAQAIRRIATKSGFSPFSGKLTLSGHSSVLSPNAFDTVKSVLVSKNERMRWAATRIFSQHFSYLTSQTEIADKLIGLLADSSVTVRMQAAKSLMQWFWWTRDEALQDRIADAFLARMAVNEHPWMRRNLRENFYSLADENVRYLYNNWVALLATPEDRERARHGHHEASRKMAERVAKALTNGNELQRENLLAALTEFHLRSGGYPNAGRYTRIGNDVETVKFYEEGAPAVEKALQPLLKSNNAATRKQAVVAAFTLRENSLEELPLLVMRRLLDEDKGVRGVAEEFYPSLPLEVRERNRQEAIVMLRELLASNYAEAKVAALDRLKAVGLETAKQEKFDEQIKQFVLNADGKIAAAAVRSLGDFPHLRSDPAVEQKLAAALQSPNPQLLRSALQLTFAKPEWRAPNAIAAALDVLLKTQDAGQRRLILGLVTESVKVENDLRLLHLIAASFDDRDDQVRAAALAAVRRAKTLSGHPAIRAAVAKIANDPNERLQEQAIALYSDGKSATTSTRTLDYDFFVARIMPLLSAKGSDGNACVDCHSTHALLKLNPPDKAGRFSEAQLRENFAFSVKMADLTNPENSLLLRKPISDASQEGVVGAKKTPHGGGPRWSGAEDAAYRTVLEWINGAKLKSATN